MYPTNVFIIGDHKVGKSSIAASMQGSSITGPDFYDKIITTDTYSIHLRIWDLKNSSDYRAMRIIQPNSRAILIVYSVNDINSFENVDSHLEELNSIIELSQYELFLVANKTDLYDHQVSTDDGEACATRINATYVEVSARTGQGIPELLQLVADKTYAIAEKTDAIAIPLEPKRKKKEPPSFAFPCCLLFGCFMFLSFFGGIIILITGSIYYSVRHSKDCVESIYSLPLNEVINNTKNITIYKITNETYPIINEHYNFTFQYPILTNDFKLYLMHNIDECNFTLEIHNYKIKFQINNENYYKNINEFDLYFDDIRTNDNMYQILCPSSTAITKHYNIDEKCRVNKTEMLINDKYNLNVLTNELNFNDKNICEINFFDLFAIKRNKADAIQQMYLLTTNQKKIQLNRKLGIELMFSGAAFTVLGTIVFAVITCFCCYLAEVYKCVIWD